MLSCADGRVEQHALSVLLSKSYPPPVGRVLENFPLSCVPGEIVVLLGPSGGGKTTILDLIAGLLEPDDQAHPTAASRTFSYAFQTPHLVPWRDATGNAYLEIDLVEGRSARRRERVDELFVSTGLEPYRTLRPGEMSTGMQQRLQLVRALARRVPLLLLDEPLGAVDQPRRLLIAQAIRDLLKRDRTATVWVTHDALEAVTVADRVLLVLERPLRIVQERSIIRSAVQGSTASPALDGSMATSLDGQATELRHLLMQLTTGERTGGVLADSQHSQSRLERAAPGTWYWILLPALVFLAVWELAVQLRPEIKFFTSHPTEWMPILFRELLGGPLWRHLNTTLLETILGLVIALPVGTMIGYTASSSQRASLAVRPYLAGLAAVPLFVLAPLFILWFGIGVTMKVALAALSALPIIAYLVHDAAAATRGKFYHYARATGGSIRRCFLHLTLPGTLEALILGVRPASIAALLGAFLGEFIAAERGLGYYIVLQSSRYHVPEVLAGVTLLFLVVALIDSVTHWIAAERNRIIEFLDL